MLVRFAQKRRDSGDCVAEFGGGTHFLRCLVVDAACAYLNSEFLARQRSGAMTAVNEVKFKLSGNDHVRMSRVRAFY